jgi:hypothetical protein
MFRDAALTDIDLLKKTWSEWNSMNWVRTAILAIGVFFSCFSLHRIYSVAATRKISNAEKKHRLANQVVTG